MEQRTSIASCKQAVNWYNASSMNTHITPVDITNMPALRRIVAEVRQSKQPRFLKQDSENVAVLMPLGTALEQTTDDIWKNYRPDKVRHVLKQSAGMLHGVDRKELLAEIAHARSQGNNRISF